MNEVVTPQENYLRAYYVTLNNLVQFRGSAIATVVFVPLACIHISSTGTHYSLLVILVTVHVMLGKVDKNQN